MIPDDDMFRHNTVSAIYDDTCRWLICVLRTVIRTNPRNDVLQLPASKQRSHEFV